MRQKHISNANVLVIAHIMFSISLLGVGSPYMGHYFQVQVICSFQGLSLGGCRSWRLIFSWLSFCITCISSQELILCKELELYFLLNPSVDLDSCKLIGHLLLLSTCNISCKNTLLLEIWYLFHVLWLYDYGFIFRALHQVVYELVREEFFFLVFNLKSSWLKSQINQLLDHF